MYGCTYEHTKIVHTHVTAREEDENVQKIEINLAHFSDPIQKYNGYDVAVVF